MLSIYHRQTSQSLAIRVMLVLLMCGISSFAFSQKISEKNQATFKIIKIGTKYSEETVVKTLESAQLLSHRFQNVSNIIVLDDATEIEIFSANKLVELGILTSATSYRQSYSQAYVKSIFSIKGNILLEQRPTATPEKTFKK